MDKLDHQSAVSATTTGDFKSRGGGKGGDCITETHGVQCPLEMCVFRQVWEASRPMIMCATPLKKMASCVCFSDGSGSTYEIQILTFGSFWMCHVGEMGSRHGFSLFFFGHALKH